jgi:hypothetical protein
MSYNKASKDILFRPGIERVLTNLCNRRRHQILLLLKQGTVQTETDMMIRGEGDIEEIETDLTSDHLPKLEEAGYIEWDRDTGEISKGPRFDQIKPLLNIIENHADELPPDWP